MTAARRSIALVLLLALAGAGSAGAQTKPPAGTPVKVGILAPLTGPGASFGDDMQTGMKLGVDYVNSHGGILGRPLQTIVKDDAGDAATSAKAALQLIQEDKVDALLGPPFSSAAAAVLPIANDAHLLHLGTSYYADEADATKYPQTFKLNVTAQLVASTYPDYLLKAKLKKAAILATDDTTGNAVANGVTAYLTKAGIAVVDREMMTTGTADVTPQLDRIRKQAPDALILALAAGPDFVAALKGLKQIGWTDVVPIGTSAINFEYVVKSAPPDVLGRSYGSGGYKNITVQCETPAVAAYRKVLSDQVYNHGPITRSFDVGASVYDGLLMIAAAANATKSLDSSVLARYLETHGYAGLMANYTYTATRHAGIDANGIVFVRAGPQKDGLSEIAPGQSCK